jgi:hypothetical protein
MQKLLEKIMLAAFVDAKSIIHHEFEPEKQTVNSKFYKEVIKRLITRLHRLRPEFRESGSWYLPHENASTHSLGFVCECFAKRGIPLLSHSPYSPDLAPATFFYFLNYKLR